MVVCAAGAGVKVVAMTRLRRSLAVDTEIPALLEQSGVNVQRVSLLLRDLLVDYPEHAELIEAVQRCEHVGDRIAREIIHRLSAGEGAGLPFTAGDGHVLATALDDIVDFAEQAADSLGVYGVEAPMEQSVALAEVLVQASAHVANALAALALGRTLEPSLS